MFRFAVANHRIVRDQDVLKQRDRLVDGAFPLFGTQLVWRVDSMAYAQRNAEA